MESVLVPFAEGLGASGSFGKHGSASEVFHHSMDCMRRGFEVFWQVMEVTLSVQSDNCVLTFGFRALLRLTSD